MKLVTNTQISIDGVVQANGASVENGRLVLERGGWARPLFDSEGVTFVEQFYQRADAFLFGRQTYDLFASYWGVMGPSSSPIADALNMKPKYVVSNTLTTPEWAHTTVISGDVKATIQKLKEKPGVAGAR